MESAQSASGRDTQIQLDLPAFAEEGSPQAGTSTDHARYATEMIGAPLSTTSKGGAAIGEPTAARFSPDLADPRVHRVASWFDERRELPKLFGDAVRQAIDDVLDGPRTGRWSREQLEKTEKIYVGTRIEILTRAALKLERKGKLDTIIAGVPVDFKWSFRSVWEIPTEAVDQVCLLIGGHGDNDFDVGLIVAGDAALNPGRNKDGKRTLSASGKKGITWIIRQARLRPNFLATIPADVRAHILAGSSGQERIRRLFSSILETPIPRLAVSTVAQQLDPMRRVRADRSRSLGNVRIFSGRYGNKTIELLGYAPIREDEFMSVPLKRAGAVL